MLKQKVSSPLRFMLPAFVWLLVITYLSTKGGIPMPKFDLLASDKLGHASAYCLLVWLLLSGIARWRTSPASGYASAVPAVLFAAGYGAMMEFVQYAWFPGRHFEYDDMLANAIGACIGWGLYSAWAARRKPAE